MQCTVLGGNGFIGYHLVSYLKRLGFEVQVPLRKDLSSLTGPLGHTFYCIGLTADFRTRPFETVDAHVSTLTNVLQRANFESFTYLSSTRIYANSVKAEESQPIQVYSQNPSDLYNLSKLLGESICFATNRPEVKVARLSNVVGLGLSDTNFIGELIRDAKLGFVKLKTHVNSAKDYIVIDDVTRLLHNIATRGSERSYNVASGIHITNGELLFELQHF